MTMLDHDDDEFCAYHLVDTYDEALAYCKRRGLFIFKHGTTHVKAQGNDLNCVHITIRTWLDEACTK